MFINTHIKTFKKIICRYVDFWFPHTKLNFTLIDHDCIFCIYGICTIMYVCVH